MSQAALDLFTSSATTDAESAAYWAYHLGRTGFFLATVRLMRPCLKGAGSSRERCRSL
jgi:hypothetical protein